MQRAAADRRKIVPALAVVAVLVVTAIVYAPSASQWFFADDFVYLRTAQVHGWQTWLAQSFDFRHDRPVTTYFLFPSLRGQELVPFANYRPLYLLTFRAEFSLFGLSATGYHCVNVVAHLLAVVLVWRVARRLTPSEWTAVGAATIFALHPAYSDAVYWVVNGNTPLATICYLLAFLLFMNYADGGSRRFLAYAGALVVLVAALLYHPATMTLLVVLPAWYFLVRHHPSDALSPRSWAPVLPFFAIGLPYLAIQQWVRAHDEFQSTYYRLGSHVVTNYRDYLGMALVPDAHTRSAMAATILMVAITVVLCLRQRWPYTAPFAVLWFYVSLAPESVFTAGAFGRLLYLPGPPLAISLSLFVTSAIGALSGVRIAGEPTYWRVARLIAGVSAAVCVAGLLALPRSYAREQPSQLIRQQSSLTQHFADDLRADDLTLAQGATLYVVNPPAFLVHLNQETFLQSLVQLYYADATVKTVPLRLPPYWGQSQVMEFKGPADRVFVFNPQAPP